MIRAISLFSLASLAAAAFSVVTNKIIAMMAGTEGMAHLGLYRNLAALVTGTLALGYGTIFLQRISTARTKDSVAGVIDAAVLLLMMQALSILFIAVFFFRILDRWMFGAGELRAHFTEIRIVLAMSLVQLFLQSASALIKGQTKVGAITAVQVATAAGSLLLIYPLLRFGSVGLALSVGAGAVIGSVVGAFYVWKFYHLSFLELSPKNGWSFLRGTAAPSSILSIAGIFLLGTHLHIQSILGKNLGLSALGNYNAALLIIGTAVNVLMSAARTYIFPLLGHLDDEKSKSLVFSRGLGLSLIALTFTGIFLILTSSFLIPLLFSSKFGSAADLLAVLSLSFLGQAYGWSYNTFMLHKGDFWTTFLMDSIWCLLFVSGTTLCLRHKLPIVFVAWAYTASYLLFAIGNVIVGARKYGNGLLGAENAWMTAGCLALLAGGYAVSRLGSLPLSLFSLCACSAGLIYLAGKSSIREEFLVLFRPRVRGAGP